MAEDARWWDIRPARGGQAKTYTCPICGGLFMAMVPNTLLSPEGDRERRRHAHTACVARQRSEGKLLTRTEWEQARRGPRLRRVRWWRRLVPHRSSAPGSAASAPPDGGTD